MNTTDTAVVELAQAVNRLSNAEFSLDVFVEAINEMAVEPSEYFIFVQSSLDKFNEDDTITTEAVVRMVEDFMVIDSHSECFSVINTFDCVIQNIAETNGQVPKGIALHILNGLLDTAISYACN